MKSFFLFLLVLSVSSINAEIKPFAEIEEQINLLQKKVSELIASKKRTTPETFEIFQAFFKEDGDTLEKINPDVVFYVN